MSPSSETSRGHDVLGRSVAEVRQATAPVSVSGVTYRIPVIVETGRTTIAVNVRGALVPTAVAAYLIYNAPATPGDGHQG